VFVCECVVCVCKYVVCVRARVGEWAEVCVGVHRGVCGRVPNKEGFAVIMMNVMHNLWHPEAVEEEHQHARKPLELIYEDNACEQTPIESRVQHTQFAAH